MTFTLRPRLPPDRARHFADVDYQRRLKNAGTTSEPAFLHARGVGLLVSRILSACLGNTL
jgi:hypothetical protein